ncbi:MAG: hypothetical protein CML99_13445 [Rhodobiaceae bacterium]|nr:hypothetical protein [Rhodobiaceae bacterium]|tara:strand:+ start:2033 stop:2443 length:411 start_codon:yes stop_codon:yes gene_type:complete
MKKILVTSIACLAALTVTAQADVFLPGHEVAQIVVGNTIEGQYRECGAARNDFVEYYAPDGKISGKERACNQAGDWTNYGGAWRVEDGKFCVNLGSERSNGCFDYEAAEDSTLTRVGEPGVGNTKFKIYDGNPEGL